MATIEFTHSKVDQLGPKTLTVSWAALTTANLYGRRQELAGYADRSVQLLGTLSTGGAVTMYGSNKPDPNEANDNDWFILTDPQGNNIALSTLKGEQIEELTRWVRPKITGGDGSTSLDVHLTAVQKF